MTTLNAIEVAWLCQNSKPTATNQYFWTYSLENQNLIHQKYGFERNWGSSRQQQPSKFEWEGLHCDRGKPGYRERHCSPAGQSWGQSLHHWKENRRLKKMCRRNEGSWWTSRYPNPRLNTHITYCKVGQNKMFGISILKLQPRVWPKIWLCKKFR